MVTLFFIKRLKLFPLIFLSDDNTSVPKSTVIDLGKQKSSLSIVYLFHLIVKLYLFLVDNPDSDSIYSVLFEKL